MSDGRLKAIRYNGWLFIDPASVFTFVPRPVGQPKLASEVRVLYDRVFLEGSVAFSSWGFGEVIIRDPITTTEASELSGNDVLFRRYLNQNQLPGFRYKDSVFFRNGLVIDWLTWKPDDIGLATLETLKVQVGKKILDNPLCPKYVEVATHEAWLKGGRRAWTFRLNAYQH